jgi:hypothetical protein
MEEIAGLDASYQHSTQEDHEEMKEKILKEYRAHQVAASESLAAEGGLSRSGDTKSMKSGGKSINSRFSRSSKNDTTKSESALASTDGSDDNV